MRVKANWLVALPISRELAIAATLWTAVFFVRRASDRVLSGNQERLRRALQKDNLATFSRYDQNPTTRKPFPPTPDRLLYQLLTGQGIIITSYA